MLMLKRYPFKNRETINFEELFSRHDIVEWECVYCPDDMVYGLDAPIDYDSYIVSWAKSRGEFKEKYAYNYLNEEHVGLTEQIVSKDMSPYRQRNPVYGECIVFHVPKGGRLVRVKGTGDITRKITKNSGYGVFSIKNDHDFGSSEFEIICPDDGKTMYSHLESIKFILRAQDIPYVDVRHQNGAKTIQVLVTGISPYTEMNKIFRGGIEL